MTSTSTMTIEIFLEALRILKLLSGADGET
jgi:hypothetical protein